MPDLTIPGLRMEPQKSPLVCWAAAAQCVLRHYGVDVEQKQLISACKDNPDSSDDIFGTPSKPLRLYNHFRESIVYKNASITPAKTAKRVLELKDKLKTELREGRPFLVATYNIEKSPKAWPIFSSKVNNLAYLPWAHVLVAESYEKQGKIFTFLDPGRHAIKVRASLEQMCSGWQIYGPLYFGKLGGELYAYARTFYLTQ